MQAGAADVQGTSSNAGVQLREQGTSSVLKDALDVNRVGASRAQEKEPDHVVFLRDRCKEMERQLSIAQAAAVLKSKQKAAVEREKFLLEEVAKASEQLLCKQAVTPHFSNACVI